jgi:hypothetical protein
MPRKSKSQQSKSKSLTKTLKNLSSIPGTPGGPGGIGSPVNPIPASNKSSVMLFAIFVGLLGLIVNIYALVWIFKLEEIPECKCSESWMRTYIKYYLHASIPVMIISSLLYMYLYSNNFTPDDLANNSLFGAYRIFAGFVSLFGFANIVIAIVFINKLKEINCECSEDIKREIYYIYNIIGALFVGLALLLAFIGLPVLLSMRK